MVEPVEIFWLNQFIQFGPMGPGPDGHMGPMGPEMTGPPMNGISGNSESMEGMKNSPANGPATPREDGAPLSDYGMTGYEENVS